MIVYLIKNKVNGKLYVGMTSKVLEERWKQHVRMSKSTSSTKMMILQAIKKYGVDSFEKSVLEECCDKETMSEREKFWIKELKTRDPHVGYNATDGGEGTPGRIVTEATRQKLRDRVFSAETRQRMSFSAILRESTMSQEAKELRKKHHSEAISGTKNPFFGKCWRKNRSHSEETKRNLSISRKGKKLSQTNKDAIRSAMSLVDKSILGSNKDKRWAVLEYDGYKLVSVYTGFEEAGKVHGFDTKKIRKMSKEGEFVNGKLLFKGERMSLEEIEEMNHLLASEEQLQGEPHGVS